MKHADPAPTPSTGGLYSPLLEAAIRLAATAHYHQFRKQLPGEACLVDGDLPLPDGCIPYITHLMGTACILARIGVRDEVVAAAMLHDYLEDVPDPDGRDTIRRVAGDEVLDLVIAVTENKRAELDATTTWETRKKEQIEKIGGMDTEAVLIKTADLLHNLQSLLTDLRASSDANAVWERFNAARSRQLWHFESVLDAARRRLEPHEILREIESVLSDLRPYAETGIGD